MQFNRKIALQTVQASAENRSRFVAATNELARDGHILEPAGILTENFLRSGTILFDHDPQEPVARPVVAELNQEGNLEIEIEWAPPGISAGADKVRGLVKAGVLRAGSVGFDPIDADPINPGRPKGGLHIKRSDLLEFSIVSVGADTGAVVTMRSEKAEDWKCGASRELPIEDSDEWDGSEAEASVFKWAGGDDFDPSKARKAFLAYNAAKPKERGSYKLPIAHIVDGRLKVPKGAIRAAASRLSSTDIPEATKKAAQAVIDHYEEKAGMAKKDGDRGAEPRFKRIYVAPVKRDLYHVSCLGSVLAQMGWLHDAALEEAAREGDDSEVPAMFLSAIEEMVDLFKAQAEEESDELLAECKEGHGDEGEDLEEADRAYLLKGKTAITRALRRGVIMARAGKALSTSNETKLEDAQGHHTRALKHHKELGEHHTDIERGMNAITAKQEAATKAHGELGEALDGVKNEPEKATEHVARCMRAHKAIGKALSEASDQEHDLADAHGDAVDAHAAIGRHLKSAQRCVRSVVEGSTTSAEGEDGDSKNVQTSAGTGESGGSSNDRAYRRRMADLKRLEIAID